MREKLTDEMIEYFARGYVIYSSLMKFENREPSTFEQYVDFCLNTREKLIGKALKENEAKKA